MHHLQKENKHNNIFKYFITTIDKQNKHKLCEDFFPVYFLLKTQMTSQHCHSSRVTGDAPK